MFSKMMTFMQSMDERMKALEARNEHQNIILAAAQFMKPERKEQLQQAIQKRNKF